MRSRLGPLLRVVVIPGVVAVVSGLALLAGCSSSGTQVPTGTPVGPSGGTVTSEGGSAKLSFPTGALGSETVVTVQEATSYTANTNAVPGTVFEFGPSGTTFSQPVQIVISYDPSKLPAGVSASSLKIYKVTDAGWQAIENSSVDTVARTVTAFLTSFSAYGVAGSSSVMPTPTVSPTPSPSPSPTETPTPSPSPSPSPPPSVETVTVDCGGGVMMELVKIPAGNFMMGTAWSGGWFENARPTHTVTIGTSFYMGKYEVTQAQYEAVKGTNPSYSKGANKPVENLSWHDAIDFCMFLSMASGKSVGLPSEAEWEYACKANMGSVDNAYYFGNDDAQLTNYAWYTANSGGQTHAVGQKQPNSFGLYDMSGNVWEWCNDAWHSDYTGAPTDGSTWAEGGISTSRVVRGGSYDQHPENAHSAYRYEADAGIPNPSRGFRVVVRD